jgi:hypothetical protein
MPDTLISTEVLRNRRPPNTTSSKAVSDLWNAYRKAWKAYCAAMDAEDAAMERALPHLPPRPASLRRELELIDGGSKIFDLDDALIGELREEHALTLEEADALRAELQSWQASCEAVKDVHGRREAEAAVAAAEQLHGDAEKAFIAAPVQSTADAVLKLRFALEELDAEERSGDCIVQALFTVLRGLRKLT